ncbi:MAG: response regulator transcription factor [Chloroflexota bacterium]
MIQPVRLVVVDDHILFRRGLIGLLDEMPGFSVVGEASNGLEAVSLILDSKPDLVLLDVNMPVMGGIETIRNLRKAHSEVKVLMLTISQREEDLIGAIVAGASGYILKNTDPEVLRKAILDVVEGKSMLAPELAGQVFKLLRRSQVGRADPLLSDRELEVLHCLARGLTTAQIAGELYISENTVKTHIRHIMEKMEVSNRTEAVAKGAALGLL